jgi:uncharacterized protein (DUF1501 family)
VLVAQSLAAFDIRARNWRAEAEARLEAMYAAAPGEVGRTGRETLDAIRAIQSLPGLMAPPAGGSAYPNSSIGNGLRQAAQIIRSGLGSRTIYVNVPGAFDTHSGQLAAHAVEYARIGDALAAFASDLGGLLADVVVMVTTEFGRTAAVNGAAGTDHGSAHCLLVMGGGVRGGRVLGGWPGLGNGQLYQGRDLAVAIDYRDVFAEIARRHLGVSDMAALFPGYTPGAGPGVIG